MPINDWTVGRIEQLTAAAPGATPFVQTVAVGTHTPDPDCICKGNWRAIVKETETLLDKKFMNERGEVFKFFGVVHASDDYYYGMWSNDHGMRLLSCVGSIEGHGFTYSASLNGPDHE